MEVSRFKFNHEAIPSVEFERVNYSDAEIVHRLLQWCVFIVDVGRQSQLTNMFAFIRYLWKISLNMKNSYRIVMYFWIPSCFYPHNEIFEAPGNFLSLGGNWSGLDADTQHNQAPR